MLTIAAIITWITSAGKFLKETGGDAAIKEGAKSVFSWLKSKFTKSSEQSKIDAVEKEPDNQEMAAKLKQLLEDLQQDEQDKFAELAEKVTAFEKLVGQNAPASHQAISHIINSKNVVSGGVTVNTSGGAFHVGDISGTEKKADSSL